MPPPQYSGRVNMAVQRKKKHRGEKKASSVDATKQANKQNGFFSGHFIKSTLVIVLIGILAGMLVMLALPASYSGPSHKHTEKAATAERKKTEDTVAEMKDDVPFETTDDSISCETLMDEAKQLLDSGSGKDAESALDVIAACILKEPGNAAARWNLAAALLQLDRVEEALPFIDEALTLAPNNKQYFLDAGKLFSNMKRPKEAVRCLEKYLELLLHASSWSHLLASISVQREDEWTFLYETDRNIVDALELLLQQYLRDKDSLIKAGYLFKVVIGLKGADNDLDLVKTYAFFSLGLCDFANGMNNLHILTEHQYVAQGYGNHERAFEIVSTHALRLFTAGLDGILTSVTRNLLMNGENVFNELLYNCDLSEDLQQINYSREIKHDDIKRILASCIIGQNVIPVIIDNGAVVHAENIFGWTPLLQVVALNSTELILQVLKASADPQSRTPSGNTALHIAAIKGSTQVVLPLTQAGLKTSDRNVLNQTALDVACSHRWFAKEFAKSLGIVNLPAGCPVPLKYVPPLKQGFKNGGWLTPSLKLPTELSSEKCDIDVLGYTVTASDILLDYLILQKPVLIRNATNPSTTKKLFQFWQRNKIIKEYGHLTFTEISQPMSEFGSNQSITSLKHFLNKMTTINEEQSISDDILNFQAPPQILQTVQQKFPILEHFKTPAVLDPSLTEIIPSKLQFSIGPTLSGISPRFHQSLWSSLVFGRRRLFLFPPKFAFHSKQHVWDWWRQNRIRSNDRVVWECIQHSGDVLILPDMWGYATINLRESIGVSSEFIYGSNEFSL